MTQPFPNPAVSERKPVGPALIQSFGITGLYGYRTISLKTAHAASILIAKNGTGKTTLLGVLDAFLRGQYSRLRELPFASIFCQFAGHPEQLVLTRSDLDEVLTPPDSGEIAATASRVGVSSSALFKFVTEDWNTLFDSGDPLHDNAVYTGLAKIYGYGRAPIRKAVQELYQAAYDRHPNVANIRKVTEEAVGGFEILYLPTYRRVELTLKERANERGVRRKRPRFDVSPGSFFTGDIQFGLGDISDRLSDMNEQVAYESNSEYRKISAAIINELIDGSFDSQSAILTKPSKDDLQLLFSRVEQGRSYGPFDKISVPNIDKIYNDGEINASSRPFLLYFLNQLDRVIEKTRGVELRVHEFVHVCNKYLSLDQPTSTSDADAYSQRNIDGKRLALNRSNFQVAVTSIPEGRRISLDALSSGEKQMISLFAKLYLYEKPKIILIDEPELSLSIDWQREILVDVVNSPLCHQMIAITHSPFVFDNYLEPYAGSIQLRIEKDEPTLFGEHRFTLEDESFDE